MKSKERRGKSEASAKIASIGKAVPRECTVQETNYKMKHILHGGKCYGLKGVGFFTVQ